MKLNKLVLDTWEMVHCLLAQNGCTHRIDVDSISYAQLLATFRGAESFIAQTLKGYTHESFGSL